ncbi:MAG: RluA family pseudouridine synthase [Betaproteobacteria bacterium]|nr:RluA family pseudouridine synthase [Betaproteobacteria bacterium]
MNDLSKDAVNWVTVGEDGAGQRIDNYLLKLLKGVPKSHVYRILRSGEVRQNGRRAGPDARLAVGDRLRVPPIRAGAAAGMAAGAAAPDGAVPPVLYEDDALVALDKPSGLAVHGGSGVSHGVIERLRLARPAAAFLELVHRLDRDTSGVLLIAKKRSALVGLHAQLREGEVDKRYLVLVQGSWRDALRRVSVPLESYVTDDGERRVRADSGGREARTTLRRVQVWRDCEPPVALLEAELETGRTHQIRVHLTHLGHPLAGDPKYGDFAWNRALAKAGLKRMFLHAHRVRFVHPLTAVPMTIDAPLAPELQRFLDSLDRRARSPADAG